MLRCIWVTAMKMHIVIVWGVTPYSLVREDQRFGVTYCLRFFHFIAGGYENTTHREVCSSVSVVWVARPENLHSISGGDGDFCLRHFLQTDFEARTVSCPAVTGVSILRRVVIGTWNWTSHLLLPEVKDWICTPTSPCVIPSVVFN